MEQAQICKKKKKNTFILKDIDSIEIDKKYSIKPLDKIVDNTDVIPVNTTKIDELSHMSKQNYFFPFIDEGRKHCVTMIDSITKKNIQTQCCFWCRHTFNTSPVGCPIEYVSSKLIQTHTSEITKEKYTIHQLVSRETYRSHADIDDVVFVNNDYYVTDGSFCSFNCCLAFINDNVHNATYSKSKHLLMKLYVDIFSSVDKINPAPSWRLLKDYGGFMTIQEFRESFTNYVYTDTKKFISTPPRVTPVGYVYEQQYIF